MLPVVGALAAAGAVVSIDTMRPVVAAAAIEAGARLVNDVSGGRAEPDLLRLVADAESAVRLYALAWALRRHAAQGRVRRRRLRCDRRAGCPAGSLRRVGIAADRLIADPGLGFAKTGEHNWTLLRRVDELDVLGVPLLIGASRKRFLGALLAAPDGTPRPARERDDASAALTALLAERGVWGVRVHAARANRDAVDTVARFTRQTDPPPSCAAPLSPHSARAGATSRGKGARSAM